MTNDDEVENQCLSSFVLAVLEGYLMEQVSLLSLLQSESNQVRVVVVSLPQLTQASFLQKNQMLQNGFFISLTLRWHKFSVACINQSF